MRRLRHIPTEVEEAARLARVARHDAMWWRSQTLEYPTLQRLATEQAERFESIAMDMETYAASLEVVS